MDVINKPKVSLLSQSFSFFQTDRRKWISLGLVFLIPLLYNSWRFFPDDLKIAYYGEFSAFWWNFSINLIPLLILIAWAMTVPRKDYAMQFILSALFVYGIYMVYITFPFAEVTPLYVDVIATVGTFILFYSSIHFVQKKYLEKRGSYYSMHVGLLHDLNHHRFMGAVCRIEGIVDVASMEDPYREICKKEIEELKETFAYIVEKYESME